MTNVSTVNNGKVVNFVWKDGVTVGQIIRVYCLFIKNHPEKEKEKENELAVAKLLEAAYQAGLVKPRTP
jgi:hypothetical protein